MHSCGQVLLLRKGIHVLNSQDESSWNVVCILSLLTFKFRKVVLLACVVYIFPFFKLLINFELIKSQVELGLKRVLIAFLNC
jgi:hypothetical protein